MPKPKQFHYRPMYYDERKERLEKMKARAAAEAAAKNASAGYTGLERGFLTERRAESKFRHSELQSASTWRFVRFLVILIMLLSLTYYLAPEFFVVFWKIK